MVIQSTLPKRINCNLSKLDEDVLHHLGMSTKTVNFKETFGNTKFVCVSGSSDRTRKFAVELAIEAGTDVNVKNLAEKGGRFVLFKVGAVLCASHGMGTPSISILLHELFKLLHYADCQDVAFLRLGTSGGIGILPGSLVVTTEAVNFEFKPFYELRILGKTKKYPSIMDPVLAEELYNLAKETPEIRRIVKGKTMCCNDFYEEQARLDGAFDEYTEKDKTDYLDRAQANGVRNIEMEGACFAALCRRAGFAAGMLCVTLLDRTKSDQIVFTAEEYERIQLMPCQLAIALLRKHQALNQN